MIPGLILPHYNRPDLLRRCIDSIDVPVERSLVIENGGTHHGAGAAMYGDRPVHIWRPPFSSIGYGGSINFGITQMADAPWWLWASNDVAFRPGALAAICARMAFEQATVLTTGFTWGAINRAAVDLVGLVDDWSFFPIYFDDNDYERRCRLAGVQWVEMPDAVIHGDAEHGNSLTIKSDERASAGNNRTFGENQARYVAKWGGPPRQEVYETPWNSGLPLWVTRPDVAGRARRQW